MVQESKEQTAVEIVRQLIEDIPEPFLPDPDMYWYICPFCKSSWELGLGDHMKKPDHHKDCLWVKASKFVEGL